MAEEEEEQKEPDWDMLMRDPQGLLEYAREQFRKRNRDRTNVQQAVRGICVGMLGEYKVDAPASVHGLQNDIKDCDDRNWGVLVAKVRKVLNLLKAAEQRCDHLSGQMEMKEKNHEADKLRYRKLVEWSVKAYDEEENKLIDLEKRLKVANLFIRSLMKPQREGGWLPMDARHVAKGNPLQDETPF
jgi:hypothetical protein